MKRRDFGPANGAARMVRPISPTRETIQAICRYIEENYSGERPITLAALGDHVGLSPFHLQRVSGHGNYTAPVRRGVAPGRAEGKAQIKETIT